MAPIAVVGDLSVRWPDAAGDAGAPALDGVTLRIEAGDVVGIVGATGSGRTTLLRCLAGIVPGLVPATVTGTIEVAGRDPRETPVAELAGEVAMVFDDPEAQLSQPTVVEEIAFGLENLGIPPAEMRERVRGALERVGLEAFGDRNPLTLSGGEQQRLALACAVVMRPRLLLLDEPVANLDPGAARNLLALAAGPAREDGIAVVIVEHDVELLAEVASRIIVLDHGRVTVDDAVGPALTTLARSGAGASVPAVTALAGRLDPAAMRLPVTVDEAAAWLVGRT